MAKKFWGTTQVNETLSWTCQSLESSGNFYELRGLVGVPALISTGAASAELSAATVSLCQGLKTRGHTVMGIVMVNLLSGGSPYFYACGRSYFWKTFSESLRGLNAAEKSIADYCKDIIEYGTKERPSSRSFWPNYVANVLLYQGLLLNLLNSIEKLIFSVPLIANRGLCGVAGFTGRFINFLATIVMT